MGTTTKSLQEMTILLGKNQSSGTWCCSSTTSCHWSRWASSISRGDLKSWPIAQGAAPLPTGKRSCPSGNFRRRLRTISLWGHNFLIRTRLCSNLSLMSYFIIKRISLTLAMIMEMRFVIGLLLLERRGAPTPSYSTRNNRQFLTKHFPSSTISNCPTWTSKQATSLTPNLRS